MKIQPHRPAAIYSLAVACALLSPTIARATDLGWIFKGAASTERAVHRKPPVVECDPCMDRVVDEIDWLNHFLDLHGSIVAKQPDIWGQSRLTRHRQEYEDELRKELGAFELRANAAIRRSDQAFLGMAMALEAATDRRRGPELFPALGSMIASGNEQVDRAGQAVIARSAPFQMPQAPPGMQFEAAPITLEPSIRLDQLSRYLNHLHELRRINEGDDISDSPGYSLNLVRVPVSITPGKLTHKGHGAEIELSARLVLGEDLLPTTFRSLVINDLVDVIAPALTWCVNDDDCARWAATIAHAARAEDGGLLPPDGGAAIRMKPVDRVTMDGMPMDGVIDDGVDLALRSLAARLPTITPAAAPTVKSRRARMPIPFSQLADAAGVREIGILIHDLQTALANHPTARPCIPYAEVRNYLSEELDAAYDFLAQSRQQPIWAEMPEWNLAETVRSRRVNELARIREGYFAAVGPDAWRTTTSVLGWAILVESTLLSERLADDIRESATARGFDGGCSRGPFYGPYPSPEARMAFNDYVCRRWPIRVFALDPVVQEQNVEDAFARRRELQIAAAMAFASGRMGGQALMRFTRRLETEMATISLNRTAIGFAHGPDTFGWRFEPRIQPPPTRNTFAAFTETLCGGPSDDAERMHRRLEAGQRECTAIVVMPAFVPFIVFDVKTRWYSLAHPADTKPSTRETMLFSRSLKAIETGVLECQQNAHLYRPCELEQLMQTVKKLDRRLPTQMMQSPIPFENTSGGFELFNTGITDLAPELVAWYGAQGVDPAGTTSLYLIGKGFSVHDTSVIAGGRKVRIELVSRELLKAEIPPGVRTIRQACRRAAAAQPLPTAEPHAAPLPPPVGAGEPPVEELPYYAEADACPHCGEACNDREVVDIHLATPYGVSSRLFVPVIRDGSQASASTLAFAEGYRLGLTFAPTKTSGGRIETARVDEFYSADTATILIRVPDTFIPPPKAELSCMLTDTATGTIVGTFGTSSLPFDARRGGYRLGGSDLRNFIGDTSRPATDKTLRGAAKPYLDALLARGRLGDEGDAVSLKLTASLTAEQQEVPIEGGIVVDIVRRGRTASIESDPEPREPAAP
jgi:hypothetical protein